MNGAFDFNKTPMAPPGTKVLVHKTPQVCGSCASHGVEDWYVGHAPKHYRCYRCYIPKTHAERISRSVEIFPHSTPMPATSSADAATEATRELTAALLNPSPASPCPALGTEQMATINHLAAIFDVATSLTPASPTAPDSVVAPAAFPSPTPILPITHRLSAHAVRLANRQQRAKAIPPPATRLHRVCAQPVAPSPRVPPSVAETAPPPRVLMAAPSEMGQRVVYEHGGDASLVVELL